MTFVILPCNTCIQHSDVCYPQLVHAPIRALERVYAHVLPMHIHTRTCAYTCSYTVAQLPHFYTFNTTSYIITKTYTYTYLYRTHKASTTPTSTTTPILSVTPKPKPRFTPIRLIHLTSISNTIPTPTSLNLKSKS